jgi:hypothetical protein
MGILKVKIYLIGDGVHHYPPNRIITPAEDNLNNKSFGRSFCFFIFLKGMDLGTAKKGIDRYEEEIK